MIQSGGCQQTAWGLTDCFQGKPGLSLYKPFLLCVLMTIATDFFRASDTTKTQASMFFACMCVTQILSHRVTQVRPEHVFFCLSFLEAGIITTYHHARPLKTFFDLFSGELHPICHISFLITVSPSNSPQSDGRNWYIKDCCHTLSLQQNTLVCSGLSCQICLIYTASLWHTELSVLFI